VTDSVDLATGIVAGLGAPPQPEAVLFVLWLTPA
jgi:hypothetical protein